MMCLWIIFHLPVLNIRWKHLAGELEWCQISQEPFLLSSAVFVTTYTELSKYAPSWHRVNAEQHNVS